MGTRKSYAGGAVATRLSADISAGATSITVADASTHPSSSNPYVIAINRGSSSEEKILVASRSGNVLTVTTRGYDSTSAVAHITNEVVEHVLDAISVDESNSFANLLTTRGDQLVYGASGAQRKAKGTALQVWSMIDGNDPGWQNTTAVIAAGSVTLAMLAKKVARFRQAGSAVTTSGVAVSVLATLVVADQVSTGTLDAAATVGLDCSVTGDTFLIQVKDGATVLAQSYIKGDTVIRQYTSLLAEVAMTSGAGKTLTLNINRNTGTGTATSYADVTQNVLKAIFVPT